MEVKERVINVLSDKLGYYTTELRGDMNLVNDLGADSLDLAEIIMGLEEEFGVKIDGSEFGDINTVNDLIEKVEKERRGW